MSPHQPHSIEILGDRFRICTTFPGLEDPCDVFADIKEIDGSGAFLNFREKRSHVNAMRMAARLNHWELDAALLELCDQSIPILSHLERIEDMIGNVLENISNGSMLCHELRAGQAVHVPFQHDNGDVDVRIQRFIDIRDAVYQSSASPEPDPGQKRKAKGEVKAAKAKKVPKISAAEKKRAKSQCTHENTREDSQKVPASAPSSLPTPKGIAERDQDDEEPTKREPPSEEHKTSSPRPALNSVVQNPSSTPVSPRSLNIIEIESGGGMADVGADQSQFSPTGDDMKVESQSVRNNNNLVTATVIADKNAEIEPDKPVSSKSTPSPSTSANIPDRIAIKQLKLDIQEMQMELDFGEIDQPKQRRLLEVLVSRLEIAQMKYLMQHGEEYSG